MNDLFWAGVVTGALIGASGLTLRLLQLGALVAVVALAWIIIERGGPTAIEPLIGEVVELAKPYSLLGVGVVLGGAAGAVLLERMRRRLPD